ncbi:uncharacterized protein LOC130622959 isoform X2 [Hydractinia symbiolongicarpus]|uniref:uncharacterized protein LOC130622959 isoform X2 n=1 Tax=Hydractinia symbiolongicarpus TaxID=13093 RepID=UPI00254FC9C1|nr:uncharacterized protein LOC130622959 isoform X2 [Hydractinia symbiolongicarpus]
MRKEILTIICLVQLSAGASWFRRYDSKKPCMALVDGKYSISDVFAYMECKDHVASIKTCKEGQIFDPKRKECIDSSKVTIDTICENRNNGNYRNPWNCHQFIMCVHGKQHTFNCSVNTLVFDPYSNRCEYPSKMQCKEIKTPSNPCSGLPNGNFPLRDVFRFMTCHENKASYSQCPKHTMFDPNQDKCVSIKSYNKKLFCKHRSTSNWRDPWNCHGFISCVHGEVYFRSCASAQPPLVYNPNLDLCVHNGEFQCDQELDYVKFKQSSEKDSEPCQTLKDGQYAIRDVFKYMTCKGGKSTYTACPNNYIYEPGSQKCVSIATQSVPNFCQNRTDGDWANPWSCHRFFKCHIGRTHNFPCQLNSLVFDPYLDACVYSSQYGCKQIGSNVEKGDIYSCATKGDADFVIPDVFAYLECKKHVGTIKKCKIGDIFDPVLLKCVDGSKVNIKTFCSHRPTMNYRDPWNCHKFLVCVHGSSVPFDCPVSSLVFDPYNNTCELASKFPCQQLSEQSAADPCETLKDGDYAIRDVFKYMTCTAGKSKYKKCPDNNIFEPGKRECVDISTQSVENFCQHRSEGDWANPWNCHGFFKCFQGLTHSFNCQVATLNYNPYIDACVYPNQYPCNQVKPKIYHNGPTNPCAHRPDGWYDIPDVFSYMQCKDHVTKYINCADGQVYDIKQKKCVAGSSLTKKNFCNNRQSGNFRDPWDCHSYVTCVHKTFIERPCAVKSLVYDPYNDLCEFPTKFKCKQLKGEITQAANPCDGKTDGNYAIPDVFKYLTCKGGKATYTACPDHNIFDPSSGKCVNIYTQSLPAFCRDRTDGDWANPWNCYQYITCTKGNTRSYPCLINGFVFNPYQDVCVEYGAYPCHQAARNKRIDTDVHHREDKVTSSSETKVDTTVEDPCTKLPDGRYPIRDVAKYLYCHYHHSHYISCRADQIFDASKKTCVPISSITLDNFCKGRPNGNWRNPWNCHDYITCHAERSFDRPCSVLTTLNYDPTIDMCQYPYIHKCVNITDADGHHREDKVTSSSETKVDTTVEDPCTKLPDGRYPIRDVAKYLYCHYHHSHYISCRADQIFDASEKTCVPISSITLDNFCKGRPNGNWRNPWNCHDYITCHAKRSFDRPCSVLTTLNYDPTIDMCQYPYIYKCVNITERTYPTNSSAIAPQIKDICTTLPDGNYATRDVLMILQCKKHVSHKVACGKGQIYIPGQENCTDASKIIQDDFCMGRSDGNWRDPWNCHAFFTCHAGTGYKRNCSLAILTYDPDIDSCDFPSVFPCKNVDTEVYHEKAVVMPEAVVAEAVGVDEPCAKLSDGHYPVRDVFVVMVCRSHRHQYVACGKGEMYHPAQEKCVSGKEVSLRNFCKGRFDGNWRNPWNCHNYITCHAERTFDRKCSKVTTLNYDPYHDACAYPATFQCKQI